MPEFSLWSFDVLSMHNPPPPPQDMRVNCGLLFTCGSVMDCKRVQGVANLSPTVMCVMVCLVFGKEGIEYRCQTHLRPHWAALSTIITT